jgi:hypothetical protein
LLKNGNGTSSIAIDKAVEALAAACASGRGCSRSCAK